MDPPPAPCEQCNGHPSVLYCLTCAKHICLSCEDSHAYNHSVVSTSNKLKCAEHLLPFDLYCESCEKLLCATCYQKHSSLQHIISPIHQVFRKKQNVIVSLMTEAAFEKKAALQAQSARLSKRISDLKSYKSTLEEGVYQQMDLILSRLQMWTAPITLRLEKERETLGRDLEAMESSMRMLNSPDKLAFLGNYRSVVATLDTVAARPITPEVEVPFDEMPREMQQLRAQVQESVLQRTINQARNDVVWDMLRNFPANTETTDAAVKREILQWSRLTDKLLQQVADLQFVCYLCKMKVAPESVNSECSMNPVGVVRGELSRDPLIPPSLLGNGFHFVVNQNGDVRKQAERFRMAERPKSKAQIQESSGVLRPTPRPTSSQREDYQDYYGSQKESTREPVRSKIEEAGAVKRSDPWSGASSGYERIAGSPAPKPSGFQSGPQTESEFTRSGKLGYNPLAATGQSSFRQSYTSPEQSLAASRSEFRSAMTKPGDANLATFGGALRETGRETSGLGRDSGTLGSVGTLGRESMGREFGTKAGGTLGGIGKESMGRDFGTKAGGTLGSIGTLGEDSMGRDFGTRTGGTLGSFGTLGRDTLGRDGGLLGRENVELTDTLRSSFNPVDSFGAVPLQSEKPTSLVKIDSSLGKEVRFSYSDSFKAEVPEPTQAAKDPPLKSALKVTQNTNWRDKVRAALSAGSTNFLSSCRTYDNGAGEISIDALRVGLHKASSLLSLDDIDQAAKYIGRDHVNYAQFLHAMTQA